MAYLTKQKKSPYWTAKIKQPSGKYKPKTTKIRYGVMTRKKAQALADMWERVALGEEHVSITEAHVVKVSRELAKTVSPEQFKEQTIAEFFKAFLSAKEKDVELGQLNQSTLNYYSSILNRFLPWLGPKGARSFKSMNQKLFEEYRDDLMKEGQSGTTVGKHLKCLRIPLNAAWASGRLEVNPAKSVKLPDAKANTRKVFTGSDVVKLSNSLTGEWLTVFLIGLYTAARLGDCARMRWEFVDIFNGTLEFTQRKTKRKHPVALVIPLHSVLWEHLKGIHKGTGLIAPALAAKVGASDEEEGEGASSPLSIEFGELMEAAKVSQDSIESKSGRKFSRKSFHSLRHTINSALSRQAKVGAEVRSRLTGHKMKGMNQHYTYIEIEEVREALALVSFVC